MIIVNDGRSTARLDGRWHSCLHPTSARVAMERGERRILHDGRWLPLRSLAWLILLFFLTAAAFGLPLQAGVDLLPPARADLQFGATFMASACALVLYALAVRLGEGRWPSELALRPALKGLAVGVGLGLLLMIILMAVMAFSGLYAITWVGLVPVWGGLSLAVQAAVTEELWMRALLFRLLWRSFGPIPAFAISALVFGALHLANPGATIVAGATVTLAGLMFCALYTLTGRLWVPIGLHLAWNFAQGSLFGASVSGGDLGTSVAHSTARDAAGALLISLVTGGVLVLAHLTGRFVVPSGGQS
jgi:membrane protease YdiL (CAAX protease family)